MLVVQRAWTKGSRTDGCAADMTGGKMVCLVVDATENLWGERWAARMDNLLGEQLDLMKVVVTVASLGLQ